MDKIVILPYRKKTNHKEYLINLEKIENDSFVTYKKQITEDDIKDTCNKRSITKLIQVKIDLNQIKQDILDAKKSIDDINEDCLKKVESLISS